MEMAIKRKVEKVRTAERNSAKTCELVAELKTRKKFWLKDLPLFYIKNCYPNLDSDNHGG